MHGDLNIFLILWNSGFVVKLVLLVLVSSSILSWAIIFQKKNILKKINENNQGFNEYFANSNSLDEIYEKAADFGDSTTSMMFQKGYIEFTKIKENLKLSNREAEFITYFRESGVSAIERSLKQAANISNDKIENKLSTLASIGSISPFVGLFGTVWGIIDSFSGLASGGGSIEAVAPGIAEALVATAVGLAAAIPAVWAYNIFNNQIGKLNVQMESFGQDFLNLIERSLLLAKD